MRSGGLGRGGSALSRAQSLLCDSSEMTPDVFARALSHGMTRVATSLGPPLSRFSKCTLCDNKGQRTLGCDGGRACVLAILPSLIFFSTSFPSHWSLCTEGQEYYSH